MSIEFLLTAFIVCLAPGIGVIYTLSTTLGRGLRAGLWAVLGCTLATVVHLGVALAGLAAVLQTSALLFSAIKYAGVAYLLYMAWGTLKGTGALQVTPDRSQQSPARLIWRGILLNLLNPKLPMFFVAFLPQFIPVGAPDATALLIELGFGFVTMTFAVFLLYALAAGFLRARVVENESAMRWMRRIFAASFAGLGAKLALERA
ncbi:LysE family translocator [Celeribacter neptunius]|uniref:Threonine/homoserine/homoserine lactone efflux protein n=1 Tax=Celeribacter neptunius TaxID=588602 RepID=A0A1I3X3C1_9RHOB|nr:LysE family translocator [Celeribacter neptunius]SFK13819.1 Threonine/homoserine/homoserine lactone efflux protein [Celeribacter neptunius]